MEKVSLRYIFSDLGEVNVDLHGISADVIDYIETVVPNGIDHFKKLDHLGRLRDVYPCAHHSRWEYIMLGLHITKLICEKSNLFGSKAGGKICGEVVSARELISSWFLLINLGHLVGTLEAERAWFNLILEEGSLFNTFLDLVPYSSKNLVKEVLKNEKLGDLAKVISLVLLNESYEKNEYDLRRLSKFLAIVEDSLKVHPVGSSKGKCKKLYNRIRSFSYLVLDVNFNPTYFYVRTRRLINSIIEEPEKLLYMDNSPENNFVKSLENMMFENIYASERATLFKSEYIPKKMSIIKPRIIGSENIRDSVIRRINDDWKTDRTRINLDESKKTLIRLHLTPEKPFDRSDCYYHREEKELESRVNCSKIGMFVTPSPNGSSSLLDVKTGGELKCDEVSRLYWVLSNYVKDVYSNWDGFDYIKEYISVNAYEEIFLNILNNYILPIGFIARIVESDRPVHSVVYLANKKKIVNWTIAIKSEIKKSKLHDFRKHELLKMTKRIEKERCGPILVCVRNVVICNRDCETIAEIDGMYFRLNNKNITLVYIEAKKRRRSEASRIKKSMVNTMEKLRMPKKVGKINYPILRDGYAFSIVDLKTLKSGNNT